MNIKILKYFIKIAECGSFSKAASLLYVTQPTLSRQIALLENELESILFLRTKPNLELTPAGKLCLEKAREIVDIYDDLSLGLADLKDGNTGEVKIGYVNLSQLEILARTIKSVKKTNPEIKIKISKNSLPKCREELLEGILDITFDMFEPDKSWGGLSKEILTDGQLYAVVPGDHPFRHKKSLEICDLKDEEMVLFEREVAPDLFDGVTNLFTQCGFTAKISCQASDMESVMMMVGTGQGIALMDDTARILETNHTVFIPLSDCTKSYAWHLIWSGLNKNPCIPLLVDTIITNNRQCDITIKQ